MIRPCGWLGCLCILLIGIPTVSGQETESIESLKKQLAQIRQELKASQRDLEQAISAGFLANDKGFSSVVEILDSLPPELKLNAKLPWDAGQRVDAENFLVQNSVGKSFKCKITVADVQIKNNPKYANDRAEPKYFVLISARPEVFARDGYSISQILAPQFREFTFSGDEDIVEKAKKIKIGKRYDVEGIIRELEFRIASKGVCEIKISLTKMAFPAMN